MEYKNTNPVIGKQSEIDFLLKFKYSDRQQTYVCDFTKYSSGQGLNKNKMYTSTKLDSAFKTEQQLDTETLDHIDEIYNHDKHIVKITKEELKSNLNSNNCCILAYDLSENPDTEFGFI